MKRLTVFWILITIYSFCPAQITFDKTYDFWEGMKLTDVFPVEDGYFLTGHIERTGGFYFLIKTDLYGDTIFTKKYYPEKHLKDEDPFMLTRNDAEIYLAYEINNGIYIQKFNLNGDSLWSRKVTDFGGLTEIIWTADSNFLILASNANLHLYKCDLFGNKIWESYCEMVDSNLIMSGIASSIIEMPDGKIKASVYYSALESHFGQTIYSFSDSGTFLQKNEIASPYDAASIYEMMNYEEDIIAIGNNMIDRFYASRLSPENDTLWVRHYLFNIFGGYFDDITRDINNNYIMAGMIGEAHTGNFDLGLICFSADGDSLWWHNYHYEGYKSIAYDIELCPDGGLAVVGIIEDLPDVKGKFLKTNELGLISGPGISEIKPRNAVKIYPNPASGVLYIEATEPVESIDMFDNLGCKVLRVYGCKGEKVEVPLYGLAPGLYLVRVDTDEGVVARKVVVK
ncbi:MAG TPA: T9SS type A sorting domain-containing protein [Bacteroidales bacterium]|nr:T9SS type A sorting domain-containing protein [Bacteroidales bacterium]HPI85665.1 T9SS type A sorting domain-containing protein [Bacteroidales bacterium]HPM91321.1 T9SS type A sorting domain-containing protein [Bacteroidales bacterium]